MLAQLCLKPLIVKTRYLIDHAGHTWHVDDYHEPRANLVVAEIELSRIDEPFERPPWIGTEVSGDPAYYNHEATRKSRPRCGGCGQQSRCGQAVTRS